MGEVIPFHQARDRLRPPPGQEELRTLVFDDEPQVATGLANSIKAGLADRSINLKIGFAATFKEALEWVVRWRPTHILHDLGGINGDITRSITDTLPGLVSLQALTSVIRRRGIPCQIIACSRRDWPADVAPAMTLGVRYLVKTDARKMSDEELVSFIFAGTPGFPQSKPISQAADSAWGAWNGTQNYRPVSNRPKEETPVIYIPENAAYWGKKPFIEVRSAEAFFQQYVETTPLKWRPNLGDYEGIRVISVAITSRVIYLMHADAEVAETSRQRAPLTLVELQVARLIAGGYSYEEVAAAIGRSVKTVESTLKRTAQKVDGIEGKGDRTKFPKVARAAFGVDILPPKISNVTIHPYLLPDENELPPAVAQRMVS